jgi:serine/threonine protein kinase
VTFPDNISSDAKEIITKLLDKNPDKRLGSKNGLQDLLQMQFFKDYDIKDLKNKKVSHTKIINK